MATIVTNLTCELTGAVQVKVLQGNLFSADNAGNTINVFVTDHGQPATLGGTISANVIRGDGTTVAVSGAIDGNRAYIILPQACYAVPGVIQIIIKNTESSTVTTIAAVVANVYESTTDTVVDPGTIIPSVASLVQAIEDAVAEIPAGYNACFAPAYSTSSTYALGQYVTYSGYLYRCTTAITSSESWTAAHWTQVALANDVSSLKSAIDSTTKLFSDGTTLLSDALTDGTGSHKDVDYTLSGNTLTAEGTSTGNSLYVLIATATPPPDWIIPGKKYIVSVKTTGQNPSITIYIKDTENTSLHTLARYNDAGEYVLEIPSNITALRVASLNTTGTVLDGSITMEISNALEIPDSIELPASVTALSSIKKTGFYYVKATNYATITDLPAQMSSTGGDSDLIVNAFEGGVTNILIQRTTGFIFSRQNIGVNVGTWYRSNMAVPLKNFASGDADSIQYDGWYKWGSSDTVSHTPGGANAGVLENIVVTYGTTAYQIGIKYSDGSVHIRQQKSGTWGAWKQIALKEDIPATGKGQYVKYESGSYASGAADARISVYLPASTGYILYRLYHFVDNSINCNGWQIYYAYSVDDNFSNSAELTVGGEWECAVHLEGRDDFSGGHTHGDEVMTGLTVLIDGVPVDISTITSNTQFKKLQIVQKSNLYDPADHTTVIADHGKEYVFENGFLTLNQSLEWKVADNLTECYMAMFLPRKSKTNRAYANSDFELLTLESSNYSTYKNKATSANMFNSTGGLSAEVSVPVYPTGMTGGDRAKFTDNAGGSYNKLYFIVCTEGTSEIGELWKSSTVYKLNYKT